MITEDYCSFEVYKLLKEKGFDGEIHTTFDEEGYTRPSITHQMAMKWLRETHNQIIVPGISLDDRTSGTINHYIVDIWYIPENNGEAFCYTSPTPYEGYPSFEEACEAGIKYCIENLI